MGSRWQVLIFCALSILEPPLSAQRAKEESTSASEVEDLATTPSMRGAAHPRLRLWDDATLASIDDVTLAHRAEENVTSFIDNGDEEEDGNNVTLRPAQGFRPLSRPALGGFIEEDSTFSIDESTRRLYGLPTRHRQYPDYFDCKKRKCGLHDKFYELKDNRTKYVKPNHQCKGAMPAALQSYTKIALEQCVMYSNVQEVWQDCRSLYCDTFEKILNAVTNRSEYFLGSDCEDLLHFNKSICLTYYRDSNAFCECICPALQFLVKESSQACQNEIIAYLLLGRRGGKLLKRWPVTPVCAKYFCKWIEKIGDPRKPVKGAPKKCMNFDLPFQRSQCAALMDMTIKAPMMHPYTPCPWEQASAKDFLLNCTDRYTCDVRVHSWACCQRHGQRMQCPKNFPIMCADPLECVGESDHCCVAKAEECASGVRGCSPLMAPNLIEWEGKVPPGVPAYIGPTTTMSLRDFQFWLARQPKRTREPESWGDEYLPYLPFFIIPIVVVGFCVAICVCLYFGSDTWKLFKETVFGAMKYITLYQTDIHHIFRPEDAPREWPELPPKVTAEDLERIAADKAAITALEDACRTAFAYGRIHLVSVHFATGPGPQQEARDIRAAVANIRARNLQETGDNPRLIEEGTKWADTLMYETMIVEALEKAYPSLTVDFKNLTKPPVEGAPWMGTVVGYTIDCEKRREVWATIEDLSASIKVAEESGGVCTGLTDTAHELMDELIARTPELPADRCVLDPEGKGVKLLPKGKNRSIWQHTGDSYLFDPDKKESGGKLNDFEIPPESQLHGTSVQAARPVCAHWAQAGKCKLGKRCPWRHCKPMAGDAIREPVIF